MTWTLLGLNHRAPISASLSTTPRFSSGAFLSWIMCIVGGAIHQGALPCTDQQVGVWPVVNQADALFWDFDSWVSWCMVGWNSRSLFTLPVPLLSCPRLQSCPGLVVSEIGIFVFSFKSVFRQIHFCSSYPESVSVACIRRSLTHFILKVGMSLSYLGGSSVNATGWFELSLEESLMSRNYS